MTLSDTLKGLKVAAVVGTILLLINQFDALFGTANFRLIPAILTYAVPFAVFTAGQYSGRKKSALPPVLISESMTPPALWQL